jgi:hypothetical protein
MNIEATDSRTTIWYWRSRKLPLMIGGNGSIGGGIDPNRTVSSRMTLTCPRTPEHGRAKEIEAVT